MDEKKMVCLQNLLFAQYEVVIYCTEVRFGEINETY